jgi:epimerase transport system membrane fusion protein
MNTEEKIPTSSADQHDAAVAALDPAIESREKHVRVAGLSAVIILFVGLGLWSVYAPLESAAVGPGVVVLENYRMALDHLEGGIVREVHAREGQLVVKGEVLLTLQDVQARAQLEQVKGQWIVALAREARLLAQRHRLSRVVFSPDLLVHAEDARVADAMRVQEETYRVRQRALQSEVTLYERQIAQLREKVQGLKEQRAMREQLVGSFEKERADFEALAKEGYAERQKVREMERNLALNDGQRSSLSTDIAATEVEISATEVKILQAQQNFEREVAKEFAEVQTELFALQEKKRALEDTLKRTVVLAPQQGVVHALSVHAPGEVLKPGSHMLDIVPGNERLIVETKLSPQDIDQVQIGQMAEVRFTAFKQRDMPKIEGRLTTLSADRMIEESGGIQQPYYLGRVEITVAGLQQLAERKLQLLAGMPADVLVKTGERTFWHYLTAPLTDMVGRSMKED